MTGIYFSRCLLTVFTNGPRSGPILAHCRRNSNDNFKAVDLVFISFTMSMLTWQRRDYHTGQHI